ncbi:MAG: type II toxin-antitoxin system HicB family antitoxin [Desulfosalsimonadaceae bacterium]
MKRDFYVIIEKDEDGFFVGDVPTLKGCYSQGKTIEELLKNMREVIELCLEDAPVVQNEFIGVQKVSLNNEPASVQS